jgi:hypothetical protein
VNLLAAQRLQALEQSYPAGLFKRGEQGIDLLAPSAQRRSGAAIGEQCRDDFDV